MDSHRHCFKEFDVVAGFVATLFMIDVGELRELSGKCVHHRLFNFLFSGGTKRMECFRRMLRNRDALRFKIPVDTVAKDLECFSLVIRMGN